MTPEPTTRSQRSGRRSARDRGTVTLWVLGWAMILIVFGGLGVDLWRGISERRTLAAQAQAAAAAGANGVDAAELRATGTVRLDDALVREYVAQSLADQGVDAAEVTTASVAVDPATNEVTVTLGGTLEWGLPLVFLPGLDPLAVTVDATASPRIGPAT